MAMPAWIPEAWNRLNEANQKQIADQMRKLLASQESERGGPDARRVMGNASVSNRGLRGALAQYADPSLAEREEGAWERAMVNKYGNA